MDEVEPNPVANGELHDAMLLVIKGYVLLLHLLELVTNLR
jgi:hypothetical protein